MKMKNKTEQDSQKNEDKCKCRGECPVQGNCFKENVVYCANVTVKEEEKTYKYFGITSNKFAVRLRNHKHTFNNENLEKSTELSKFVWELNRKEKEFEIHWEIVR